MAITAEYIVKLFERDEKARKRLAELLVSEPDVRLAIINAVLRDVATKQDITALRQEIAALREWFSRELRETERSSREYSDRRFAELKEYVDKRFMELRDYVDKRFTEFKEYVDRRFEQLESRVKEVEKRVESVREQLLSELRRVEERVSRLEERMAGLEARVSLLAKILFAFNLPILLAVIGILLRMLWQR